MPIWVEDKLIKIVNTYSKNIDDPKVFSMMRESLSEIGLEKLLPRAIEKLLEGNK